MSPFLNSIDCIVNLDGLTGKYPPLFLQSQELVYPTASYRGGHRTVQIGRGTLFSSSRDTLFVPEQRARLDVERRDSKSEHVPHTSFNYRLGLILCDF